jgi:hypothetical protein
MDSIADMGGVLGYGPATAPVPALLARATALRAVDDHEDHHP